MRRWTTVLVAVVLVWGVVSCGGDGSSDGAESGEAVAAAPAQDDAAEPTAAAQDDAAEPTAAPQDDAAEPTAAPQDDAAETSSSDVEALCRANDDLAAFNEQELAEFGPGADRQAVEEAVASIDQRFQEMVQLAPVGVDEDLDRYSQAFSRVIELAIDADFDFEALPQEELDAFIEEFPDLNLFESSPVENRIREWFAANCQRPFAF